MMAGVIELPLFDRETGGKRVHDLRALILDGHEHACLLIRELNPVERHPHPALLQHLSNAEQDARGSNAEAVGHEHALHPHDRVNNLLARRVAPGERPVDDAEGLNKRVARELGRRRRYHERDRELVVVEIDPGQKEIAGRMLFRPRIHACPEIDAAALNQLRVGADGRPVGVGQGLDARRGGLREGGLAARRKGDQQRADQGSPTVHTRHAKRMRTDPASLPRPNRQESARNRAAGVTARQRPRSRRPRMDR